MAHNTRDIRAARNEDVFRRINDRLHVLSAMDGSSGPLERFICECAQTSCSLIVELTEDEYRSVRATETQFLVFPEATHTRPDLEVVVERTERYWIVQKRGEAGQVAEELDEGIPDTFRQDKTSG